MRRVVVTGIGLVTPLGTGKEKTWKALINGECGIEKITAFEKEFKKKNHENLNEWKKVLPSEFEFNEIRILMNHYSWLKNKENSA